ncbi:hypothetical protein BDK51DRAFT_25629 [Blyttiomyces helicus]|uniref:P-loop containing nucleoside triphosphate hydrolase protein n=1 Tax=Blyttiomyces helicus TaxID=388810 RepID=A0A4P9WMA7_9FUNG|nr:hypothetical protein BDK51DRAFT_25629 [Blyttiomyces helicus]|eukprot:RKO94199.1 hypothetical protein BDK51DRAFT_25629 [Blyttiomyces helicus]
MLDKTDPQAAVSLPAEPPTPSHYLESRKNKILLIGRPEVGKVALIDRILQQSNQSVPSHDPLDDEDGVCIPWKIDTKYFTADVRFWVASTSDDAVEGEDGWEQIGHAVDGFIFVYDKAKPETFADIHRWASFLEKFDPNVALCVASTMSATEPCEEPDEHREWCVEHGVEFVDMDETPSEGGADEDNGDKVGFDRVVEALGTNMWDGMERKQGGSSAKPGAFSGRENSSVLPVDIGDFEALTEIFGDDDEDELAVFEESLRTLTSFKEHQGEMSLAERRALADKLARALDLSLSDSDEGESTDE